MLVKKLSFYLDSVGITVCSDHLPLKRFLEKNTLNAKVNNWAVELESQKIDFVFIQGTKNVLADTLSRLIEIDDDIKLPAEQEGHEFFLITSVQLFMYHRGCHSLLNNQSPMFCDMWSGARSMI